MAKWGKSGSILSADRDNRRSRGHKPDSITALAVVALAANALPVPFMVVRAAKHSHEPL